MFFPRQQNKIKAQEKRKKEKAQQKTETATLKNNC